MPKLPSAPSRPPKMTHANRVRAIVGALRDLGPSRAEVIREIAELVDVARSRHGRRSPSDSRTVKLRGWDGTFLGRHEPGGTAVVSPQFLPMHEFDDPSLNPAERETMRRERVAVTIAAVVDDPEATHEEPWPVVLAPPLPNGTARSWELLEQAIAATGHSPLSARVLAAYTRAAATVIAVVYGDANDTALDLVSNKTPRVAPVAEAVVWLRDRSWFRDMFFSAHWYEETAGIKPAHLRDAARRGTVKSQPLDGRAHKYRLADVLALWPEHHAALVARAWEVREFGG
ncbi:MAG: hypothetical protein ACTS3F_12570 [Phycisphaerales bacterium]